MSSFANRYDRLKHSLSCVFSKPGKWWDYALNLLIVIGFISIKDDLNEWLSLSFGDRLIAFSSYLTGNRFLLWLIVSAFAVGVGYYCSRKLKDQYRSISLFLILLFVLIALSVSKSNWDYVLIVGKVSFFHLIVTGLAAVGISVLVVSPRNKQRKPCINKDEGDSKCFTIDNVKASVAKADKNRTDYAKDLVERILNTRMDEEAFSVGISGEWGSGKSTFLELLKQEFEHDSSGRVSTIVEFYPWDGASSGQIVSDFFNVLVCKLGERYSVVKTPPQGKFGFFAKICHFLTGLVKHPAPMVSTLQLLSKVAVRAAETITTFSFHGKYTAKGLENDKLAESTFGFCKKITGIRSIIVDF